MTHFLSFRERSKHASNRHLEQQTSTLSRWRGHPVSPNSFEISRTGVQGANLVMRGAGTLQLRKQRSKLNLAREREQQRARLTNTRVAHSSMAARPIKTLESMPEDAVTSSPKRTPSLNLGSNSSLDNFSRNAPKEYLLKCPQDRLVEAILSLRSENNDYTPIIPPRTSSQPKEQLADLNSPTRRQGTIQEEDLLRNTTGLVLASEKVARLELEVNQQRLRAEQAEEKVTHLLHLEEVLQREREKVAEAEKQTKRTLKELATATRTEGTLYDDNHFRGEVKSLRYSIDNWVRNQSWRVTDDRSPPSILKQYQFLKLICRSYLDYIESPSALRTLVQSFIWFVLEKQVFNRNIWAESREDLDRPDGQNTTSNPFSAWQAYIEKTVDDAEVNILYHDWRVANARLMAARNSVTLKRAVEKKTRSLGLDLDDNLKHIVEGDIDLDGLGELFHSAVKLDALIQRQRPYYIFYPGSRKALKFDETTMDIRNKELDTTSQDSQRLVKLVVQPGFHKFGNSAGRNYDRGISLLSTIVELK